MRAPNGSRNYRRTGGRRTPYTKRNARKTRGKTPVKRAVAGAKRKARTLAKAPVKRAVKKAVVSNTMAINSVFRKVQANTKLLHGYYQTATYKSPAIYVHKGQPCCLHLNNLNGGNGAGTYPKGPAWLRCKTVDNDVLYPEVILYQPTGSIQADVHAHETWVHRNMDARADRLQPICNGPKCHWKGLNLQIQVTSFCADTTVNFYIVQEKKQFTPHDPWNIYNTPPSGGAVQEQNKRLPKHLPFTLADWKGLAGGMSTNRIDFKRYTVLAKRSMYFNARINTPDNNHTGGGAVADTGHETQSDLQQQLGYNPATTSFVQRRFIKMKFDRTLRQLESNVNESTGHRDQDEDVAPQQGNYDLDFGPWSYDNMDPTKNVWLIAVSDDNSSGNESTTQERIKLEVIRRVWWQDDLPPNRDHTD